MAWFYAAEWPTFAPPLTVGWRRIDCWFVLLGTGGAEVNYHQAQPAPDQMFDPYATLERDAETHDVGSRSKESGRSRAAGGSVRLRLKQGTLFPASLPARLSSARLHLPPRTESARQVI